jgi:DnaK suppressor protein
MVAYGQQSDSGTICMPSAPVAITRRLKALSKQEYVMDTEQYKKMLLAKEQELLAAEKLAASRVKDEGGEEVRDFSDEAVIDEEEGSASAQLNANSALLREVRDALRRIEDGTFGRCKVDGKPIEEKRLKEVPWAAYCLKHQKELEKGSPAAPTL